MKAAILFLAVVLAAAAGGALWFGAYDVAASSPHFSQTYRVLEIAMRRSIKVRAERVKVPPLGAPSQVAAGLSHFHAHCAGCHGAPGIAPESFALGMAPPPANLVLTAREWQPAELFWTVKHGIKMSGMPAWSHRMSDDDIWALVAFMRTLPELSPQEYRQRIAALSPVPHQDTIPVTGPPDAGRGRRAMEQYLCVTCHVIPGIVGSHSPVGPPLAGMARREFIAGVLTNTPENMIRWLRFPQEISPRNAMPNLGVTEAHARDIAAYLYALE